MRVSVCRSVLSYTKLSHFSSTSAPSLSSPSVMTTAISSLSTDCLTVPSINEVKAVTSEDDTPKSISSLLELCDEGITGNEDSVFIQALQPFRSEDVRGSPHVTRFRHIGAYDEYGGVVQFFHSSSNARNSTLVAMMSEFTRCKINGSRVVFPFIKNNDDGWRNGVFSVLRVIEQSFDHYTVLFGRADEFIVGSCWSSYVITVADNLGDGCRTFHCGKGVVGASRWDVKPGKERDIHKIVTSRMASEISGLKRQLQLMYELVRATTLSPDGPLSREVGVSFAAPTNRKRKLAELQASSIKTEQPVRFEIGDFVLCTDENGKIERAMVTDRCQYNYVGVTDEGKMKMLGTEVVEWEPSVVDEERKEGEAEGVSD
jgi:hypothetical protein